MKRWVNPIAVFSGVALLLAVWVTSTDGLRLLQGGKPANDNAHLFGVNPHPPGEHHRHGRPPQSSEGHDLTPQYLKIIEDVVLGLVGAVCLAFLLTVVMQHTRQARARRREAATEDSDVIDAFDVPPDVVATAQRQLVALREGTPRNAIVACWMELERACSDSGFPRDPAETSTEFTSRVLAHFEVREDVIASLAALYREARFSEHQLAEQHREQAIDRLRQLLADLQTRHAARAKLVVTP